MLPSSTRTKISTTPVTYVRCTHPHPHRLELIPKRISSSFSQHPRTFALRSNLSTYTKIHPEPSSKARTTTTDRNFLPHSLSSSAAKLPLRSQRNPNSLNDFEFAVQNSRVRSNPRESCKHSKHTDAGSRNPMPNQRYALDGQKRNPEIFHS